MLGLGVVNVVAMRQIQYNFQGYIDKVSNRYLEVPDY